MSLYLENDSSTHQPLPGVEVIPIGSDLSIGEFEEFARSLTIPEHYDIEGKLVSSRHADQLGDVIVASRTTESPRDPWAPDHHWHSDRSYWGENPFASVLYARRLIGNVATTGMIDTTLLLEAMESDSPGLTEELAGSEAAFSISRYYKEVLPLEGSPEAIRRTLEDKGARSLGEVAAQQSLEYPEKSFPAIPIHPFRGNPCIMVDDVRLVSLTNLAPARSKDIIKLVRDKYLGLPKEELALRPYHYLHHWEEGQALIYPQIGTLHRAMPSPSDEERRDTLRLFIA